MRPRGDTLELVVLGDLDVATGGALVRTLVAVLEPSFSHVHLDLREVAACGDAAEVSASRCGDVAQEHHASFRVTPPRAPAVPPVVATRAAG